MSSQLLDFDILAEDNIRTLKVPQVAFKRPPCVVLVGYPGSGKTHLIQRVSEKLPYVVLDEKDIMGFLAPRATIFKKESVEVFELALKTIENLVARGKAVIYDANLKTPEQRLLTKGRVEDKGGIFQTIAVTTPKEICYERVQKQNLAVTRGESKGFILDKDYFEYEVATTSLPTTEESRIVFDGQSQESLISTIILLENLLKQP